MKSLIFFIIVFALLLLGVRFDIIDPNIFSSLGGPISPGGGN